MRHVSLPRWPPLDLSLQPLVARPADPAELKEKSFVLKARNQSQRHPPPEMVHPLKVGWRQTTACILHLQANPPCWQSQSCDRRTLRQELRQAFHFRVSSHLEEVKPTWTKMARKISLSSIACAGPIRPSQMLQLQIRRNRPNVLPSASSFRSVQIQRRTFRNSKIRDLSFWGFLLYASPFQLPWWGCAPHFVATN